jgi:hypothetical protein
VNQYLLAFMKLGDARDTALTMIAGLCLTFVLAYGMLGLYRCWGIANEYWLRLGRFGIVATVVTLYLCSWFVG